MPENSKNAFDTMEKVERDREKSWCIEKSKNKPNITMELKKKIASCPNCPALPGNGGAGAQKDPYPDIWENLRWGSESSKQISS